MKSADEDKMLIVSDRPPKTWKNTGNTNNMTIMGEPYFDSRSPSKQYESPELIKSNISDIYLTPKTQGSPTGTVSDTIK